MQNFKATYRKDKRLILLILAAAILVLVSVPVYFYIQLSGGIGNIILDMKPAPNLEDPKIIAKKDAAKQAVDQTFKELDQKIGFASYATLRHSDCFEGQNNFKVQDGYAHKCFFRTTRFYGFNGDFRQQMISFEQKINADGWRRDGESLQGIMTEYYDKYYGDKDAAVSASFGGKYLVSHLPKPYGGYKRYDQLLSVNYAEVGTEMSDITYQDDSSEPNIEQLFTTITKENKYVFIVSIEKVYFQN